MALSNKTKTRPYLDFSNNWPKYLVSIATVLMLLGGIGLAFTAGSMSGLFIAALTLTILGTLLGSICIFTLCRNYGQPTTGTGAASADSGRGVSNYRIDATQGTRSTPRLTAAANTLFFPTLPGNPPANIDPLGNDSDSDDPDADPAELDWDGKAAAARRVQREARKKSGPSA